MDHPLEDLRRIFAAGVKRVDPYEMIRERMWLDGNLLRLRDDSGEITVDLARFSRLFVIGAGKATAKMALAVEELLADRLTGGLISVKAGHTERLSRIRTIEAGHPVPNAQSVRAGAQIASLCAKADESTLFIGLISGGGSACLCAPREWTEGGRSRAITLEEKQQVTELLLSCGAEISEINCVRKHLSSIKGGGLARMMAPASSLNIILSDVVGDQLDAIASGLTVGDSTTFSDARAVLERYHLLERVPESVRRLLEAGADGAVAETPKPGDRLFDPVRNVLLGTNLAAVRASGEEASRLGYHTRLLSSQITGEAREIAKFYLGLAFDIATSELAAGKPACLIGGGETTVSLRGGGRGGRNQEMALSFLRGLAVRRPRPEGLYFLPAGTDGNDGPTDAAGAFACREALGAAQRLGLDIERFLEENDSYTFFDRTGWLFRSGPTNTNVGDLHLLIVAERT